MLCRCVSSYLVRHKYIAEDAVPVDSSAFHYIELVVSEASCALYSSVLHSSLIKIATR